MDKGVNIMETLGAVNFCRKVGAVGNVAAEKENKSTQVAYRDDYSDAQYYR